MRRKVGFVYHAGFLFVALLLSGCAALPGTVLLPDDERQTVEQRFYSLLAEQGRCGNTIDVRATVTLKSFWRRGALAGYLLAKSPSRFSFVGVNPLGQPLVLLASDGVSFRYVSVPEATSFEGSVSAAAFAGHAPKGFDPKESFSWLTGRLPVGIPVLEIVRDKKREDYRLRLGDGDKQLRRYVFFDSGRRLISGRMLADRNGKPLMEVRYKAYQKVAVQGNGGTCMMPGRIEVSSSKRNGASMTVAFSDWLVNPPLTDADFVVSVPAGFERVPVQ